MSDSTVPTDAVAVPKIVGAAADPRDEFPVKLIEKTTPEFIERVKEMCARVNLLPLNVLAVMSFESGFNPAAVNKFTRATGLIQFLPSTAKLLGTTVEALAKMSALEQLPTVERYFAAHKSKFKKSNTLEDTYMSVLFPAAIGKGAGHVLFRKPEQRYTQNKVLDVNNDGVVTVGEATAKVRARITG